MLRISRITLALLSLIAMTALFVDFSGSMYRALSFLPKVQLIPAILSLNFVAIGFVAALTLLFGRVYCSVLCPLGIVQDVASRVRLWLSPRVRRRGGIYRPSRPYNRLRIAVLALFVLLAAGALTGLFAMSYAGLLDPYSIFGRAAGQIGVPLWRTVATAAADTAAASGHYVFDGRPGPSAFSWGLASIAAVQIIIVLALAWRKGRIYCNAFCPVGTALGAVSKHSLFRIVIDEDKCVSCGLCARHCKSECIDPKAHTIDHSRCVACMDCLDHCSSHALSFSPVRRRKVSTAPDKGRRAFMAGAGIVVGTLAANAADKVTDGGLAPLKTKRSHEDTPRPVPPGAISMRHFASHCTACQLCVGACPSGVLRPSLSPDGFMQPRMHFTGGYCRTECVRCAEVCPSGAIRPIDTAQKTDIRIGVAVVDPDACISAQYGQHCGTCARNCPTHAITMVAGPNGHERPAVDAQACIGCGKCEYVCPVGTAGHLSADKAAIHVAGLEVHIKK